MEDEDKIKTNEAVNEAPKTAVEDAKDVLDAIKKEKEELKAENDRKEKIKAEDLLSSSAGGAVEQKQVSEKDRKAKEAAAYFEGTQLEKDIKRANE
ncbi:hypothetical protein ACFL1X_12510 [Candidatus Hydrogenedentota bacterium]